MVSRPGPHGSWLQIYRSFGVRYCVTPDIQKTILNLIFVNNKTKPMIEHATLQFLKDLKKNNKKEWFDANRNRYDNAKLNFENFTGEVLKKMGKFDEKKRCSSGAQTMHLPHKQGCSLQQEQIAIQNKPCNGYFKGRQKSRAVQDTICTSNPAKAM